MGKILEKRFKGKVIHFHPEKVLFLPHYKAMILADVHLGKAEFFQKYGIALSNYSHEKDIHRIK